MSRIAHDTCIEFGASLAGWWVRVRLWWPRLCGAENLIHRFRTDCYQLDAPEWLERCEFGQCPELPGLPHGLTNYHDDGWRCYRCGARPFWPAHECGRRKYRIGEPILGPWPHLCFSCAADPACIYAICNQRGVCIYPIADGSGCSLIVRGKP